MKANKGCVNQECEACKNKIKYKDSDQFCSKCGQQLYYVCSGCWKVMDDESEGLCLSCKAKKAQKHQERVDSIKGAAQDVVEVVGAVGAAAKVAVGATAGVAAVVGPKVIDIAKKAKVVKK